MVFEPRSAVHASYPFNKFRFVFISQPGTNANAEMTIRLPSWCKLCQCLQSSPPESESDMFFEYTGLGMTKENIDHAFSTNVFISVSRLHGYLSNESNSTNKTKPAPAPKENPLHCNGIQSDILDKYYLVEPADCTTRWVFSKDKWRSKECFKSFVELDKNKRCQKCPFILGNQIFLQIKQG